MNSKVKGNQKIITLFEYDQCPYEELLDWGSDKVLEGIEALNKSSGKQLIALSHNYLSGTQFVGMVQVGNVVIEVLPKIDYAIEGEVEDGQNKSAASNLLIMLAYANDIEFDSQTLSSLKSMTGNWYELLIRFFAMELHQQIRQGLFRNYISREDTLKYVKGRWDISQQIKKHAYSKVDFDLTYDEFTENILLNRLFKTISNILLRYTRNNVSRRLLMDVRQWLGDVDEIYDFDKASFSQIHFSRLNDRFKDAYRLAKLFFEGQTLQVREGNTEAFAFVFDMNQLFEGYITQFLVKHRKRIFQYFDSIPAVISQFSSKSTYLAKDSQGHGKIHLRPDVVLQHPVSKSNLLILDTKYKQLSRQAGQNDLSPSDIYQMLAYSIRMSCDKVVLLFPQNNAGNNLNDQLWIKRDEKMTRIFVRTVNLHQPLEKEMLLIKDFRLLFKPIFGE